jgi:hypothetical protein
MVMAHVLPILTGHVSILVAESFGFMAANSVNDKWHGSMRLKRRRPGL